MTCISEDSSLTKACLLLPQKSNIDLIHWPEGFPKDVARVLKKGDPVRIAPTAQLTLATKLAKSALHSADGLVAVYADDMFQLIDEQERPRIVIVVPFVNAKAEQWRKTWNPAVPGQRALAAPEDVRNPIVWAALSSLSSAVNLSTGLTHPRDAETTKETLLILRRSNEWESPDGLQMWALRNGWTAAGAAALCELARKIESGRGYQPPRAFHWASNIIDIWKAEASSGDSG